MPSHLPTCLPGRTPTYLRMDIYTNACLQARTHACTHACMHAYLPTCTHARPQCPHTNESVCMRTTYIRSYLLPPSNVRTYVLIYLPPSPPKPTHPPNIQTFVFTLAFTRYACTDPTGGVQGACHPWTITKLQGFLAILVRISCENPQTIKAIGNVSTK